MVREIFARKWRVTCCCTVWVQCQNDPLCLEEHISMVDKWTNLLGSVKHVKKFEDTFCFHHVSKNGFSFTSVRMMSHLCFNEKKKKKKQYHHCCFCHCQRIPAWCVIVCMQEQKNNWCTGGSCIFQFWGKKITAWNIWLCCQYDILMTQKWTKGLRNTVMNSSVQSLSDAVLSKWTFVLIPI